MLKSFSNQELHINFVSSTKDLDGHAFVFCEKYDILMIIIITIIVYKVSIFSSFLDEVSFKFSFEWIRPYSVYYFCIQSSTLWGWFCLFVFLVSAS